MICHTLQLHSQPCDWPTGATPASPRRPSEPEGISHSIYEGGFSVSATIFRAGSPQYCFNILINDADSRFADETELSGVVDMPEGRDGIAWVVFGEFRVDTGRKYLISNTVDPPSNSIREKILYFKMDHSWLLRWMRLMWLVVINLIMIKKVPTSPVVYSRKDCLLAHVKLL